MKPNIHPKWYPEAKVTCTCGNTFTVGSTLPEINVEVCSHCHPFFTGKMKFVDTQGRVEKFQKKVALAKAKPYQKKKDRRKAEIKEEKPLSLKEMLKRRIKKPSKE
ncbi:MAG: 50S ribosomal protein L31 [Microgenomates group bacterium]